MTLIMKRIFFALLLITCNIVPTISFATQMEKKLWVEWEVHNPNSTKTISHTDWNDFISSYVTTPKEGLSLVKYARVTPQDHDQLKAYLKSMSKIDISSYNRNEQLAYWLNLYNALVVNLVIKHYPIDTIQQINISPGLFSKGPWDAGLIKVNNTALSLHDIRNKIIRPIWNDPRTLYALCNSAIGAPNIPPKAFTGKDLHLQLNNVAVNFINALRGVQIAQEKLIVSQLFDWYEEDYGGSKQAVINHIKLFADPKLKKQLKSFQTINSYTYNWHINSQIMDDE